MADKRSIETWAKRLEKVMQEAPRGCWLYIANGTAHVMKLGSNGKRIMKADRVTFDDKAIVYTLADVTIAMDGGDW